MEMDKFPGKIWVVSHKPVAVAAGLGMMGIHRNVIHQKFGNFILLGTILIESEVTEYDQPIDYNPCLECKLCVAACPVGAISPEGDFNFSACYTHNYREFMGGFTDWTEQVADSKNRLDYRKKVTDAESASMWQSLSFGANYKAAYCLSVCPAGEDVIGPYLADKKTHLKENRQTACKSQGRDDLRPEELGCRGSRRQTISQEGCQACRQQFAASQRGWFLAGRVPLVFQPNKSEGLDATYHFTFTGAEDRKATIVIRNKKITAEDGHVGEPNLRVTVDTKTWFGFLAKEKNLVGALLRRKIRMKGSPKLLIAFGKCFPQ